MGYNKLTTGKIVNNGQARDIPRGYPRDCPPFAGEENRYHRSLDKERVITGYNHKYWLTELRGVFIIYSGEGCRD